MPKVKDVFRKRRYIRSIDFKTNEYQNKTNGDCFYSSLVLFQKTPAFQQFPASFKTFLGMKWLYNKFK